MFNLSDKELDRLSREAAQEYDPGPFLGSRSWETLEGRLDKELTRFNPGSGALRGFRRLPFYFAPAILLLIGVSYLLIKPGKNNKPSTASAARNINGTDSTGSPPGTRSLSLVKAGQPEKTNPDLTTKTTDHTFNSTSKPKNAESDKIDPERSGLKRAEHKNSESVRSESVRSEPVRSESDNSGSRIAGSVNTRALNTRTLNTGTVNAGSEKGKATENNAPGRENGPVNRQNPSLASGRMGLASGKQHNRNPALKENKVQTGPVQDLTGNRNGGDIQNGRELQNGIRPPVQKREAGRSEIRTGRSFLSRPRVDDSALRAFTAIAPPIPADKKKEGLHINRTLQFGVLVAPDFSSVHSQAGDKPGSTLGITVDYQFAGRWYLSSGLFYSRKNYSARAEDYHAPYDFYQANNLHDVNFIKGSFHMLEIPLNIRYDFSVVNNTTFFVSGGVSSYMATSEKTNYYYDFFGIEACRPFDYQLNKPYLFSAANLSFGVETGISNDFSLQVAPYMKFPLSGGGLGFGQVRMSSIGINFSLKYAPVLSRKRH